MEALDEGLALTVLEAQEQLARQVGLLVAQVLDVHLGTFEGQLDLHVTRLRTDPQKDLMEVGW